MTEKQKIKNKIAVVILQHPQEPSKELGSAKLAERILENCKIRIGLSWPNLKSAVQASDKPEGKNWLVLYLGTKKDTKLQPGTSTLQLLSKKGNPISVEQNEEIISHIRGVILLDGSWEQAKTMWWRNPWLLKCQRGFLRPKQRSLYGEKRKEPRPECLSTIESIAFSLVELGESKQTGDHLLESFREFLTQ
ncbi:MAG: DTW domain-containing protein [Bacteriovoracia bacterium]